MRDFREDLRTRTLLSMATKFYIVRRLRVGLFQIQRQMEEMANQRNESTSEGKTGQYCEVLDLMRGRFR